MIRKVLLFPPLFLFAVAGFYLLSGNFFFTSLWMAAGFILTFIFWPVSLNMADKQVPLPQLFFSALTIIWVFMVAFFYDFKSVGFTIPEALGYGFVAGLGVVILIMFLKGN